MQKRHLILGIIVTMIWGANFSVIKIGLADLSPYLLAALRFFFCVFPCIFFVKKPDVPFRYIFAYGLFLGVLQFSFLFFGISLGVSAGMASFLLQLQVFFTVALSILIFKESIQIHQAIGMIIAFVGLSFMVNGSTSQPVQLGLILIVLSALSWAVANIIVKKTKIKSSISFLIWSSLIPPIPLFLMDIITHGFNPFVSAISHITWIEIGSVFYLVYPTTLFGYMVWNKLLIRYQASQVTPLTLLVPIFGMISSIIIFNEQLSTDKVSTAILVFSGLLINQFGYLILKREKAI
ncbi:EamA family transporter [Photobacterium sp. GJ3]|uniref:EamA family transporter n=1 Tax=Photobacterium sp. GJ3 TaxID=2829502 RepID=UPI001B8ABEAA|nr:EamA family transporter [Photobacterium sp. GJ3]QUJ66585.1 EamA family transporter [Photobacterium sp. GJ3]